jgi:hypothetical protein
MLDHQYFQNKKKTYQDRDRSAAKYPNDRIVWFTEKEKSPRPTSSLSRAAHCHYEFRPRNVWTVTTAAATCVRRQAGCPADVPPLRNPPLQRVQIRSGTPFAVTSAVVRLIPGAKTLLPSRPFRNTQKSIGIPAGPLCLLEPARHNESILFRRHPVLAECMTVS